MNVFSFTYRNINYSITSNGNNTLTVSVGNQINTFKVKEHYQDYTYAIRKTFVGCQSIENLLQHFKNCVEENFCVDCWCINPLNAMLKIKQVSNL